MVSSSRLFAIAVAVSSVVPAWAADSVPENLVVDLRIFEARSTRPDFQTMENLAFFVDTDGSGVSEQQWLATIARKIPDSFLTTLAHETVSVDQATARFELIKRTRSFELLVDLTNFLAQGTFEAKTRVDLSRSGAAQREFERPIELRVGQTYIWAGRDLEISASEYLSHFRDFDNDDHRGELYGKLRDYTIFLVLAATPRSKRPSDDTERVEVQLDDSLLPELVSPLGIRIAGEIELELDVDQGGTPAEIFIVRSSIPEVNPRILGAAANWRFPEAAGRRARLKLVLKADPR